MNIIGEGFNVNIIEEINRRQKIQGYRSSGNPTKVPQVLDYLNSRTGWVRMASSVDITSDELNSPSINSLGLDGSNLAEEFILFNGISSLYRSNKRGGIMGAEYDLTKPSRNIVAPNKAYGIGDTKNYGQSPMMGITSVNVKTETRGSLKTAVVQIKAWNKLQFDIIDNLYLRLGFNVLIEWGHSHYFQSGNNDFSNLNQNTFSLKDELFNKKYDYYGLLELAQNKRLQSYGNYDAMIGKVVNFNWTFNPDGSYDITVILRSQGDVIESLKTNILLDTKPNLTNILSNTGLNPNLIYENTSAGKILNSSASKINQTSKSEKIDTSTELGKFYNKCVSQVNASLNTKAGCTVSSLNPESTTQDILKQIYQDDVVCYYIRFGALLEFIQNKIVPKLKFNNNFTPILKFDTDIESNLIYTLGQTYSFSSKPDKCLVRNSITLNNKDYTIAPNAEPFLDNIKKSLDSTPSSYQAGKLMNIYINFDFLMSLFTPTNKDDGRIILIKFLQDICVEISNALGNVNSLNVTIDETTNKVVIIDQNSIPNRDQIIPLINPSASTQLAVFELFGYKNLDTENAIGTFIQDFSLKTSITPQFANMITIGATSQGYVVGEDATILSRINRGLTDRIKSEIVNADYASFTISSSLETAKIKFEENAISLINYIEQTFSDGTSLPKITSNLTSDIQSTLRNTIETGEAFNAISASLSNSNISSNRSGFIPFNLSLTMDGLSGMKVYQKFTVNNDYLPSNYPKSLEFIVTSINNTIQNNKWITQIESLSLPKITSQANLPLPALTTVNATSLSGSIVNNLFTLDTDGFNKSSQIQETIDFFKSKRFTPPQIAGIIGNLLQESGLEINRRQVGGGPGYGIAQWEPPRRNELEKIPGYNMTLISQLEFIWKELNSTEKKALKRLRLATNAASAADIFEKEYERSSKSQSKNRIGYANDILNKINAGIYRY